VTGTLCLQGGGEFSPGCRDMDAALLALADGPVVVTALAGAVGGEYATANANGVRHFRSLGADEVVDAPDVRVDTAGALDALRRARLLVLPGGSPSRLLAQLRGTAVGQVVTDLLAAGGVVSGSSAGAMVLCAWTVLPDRGPSVEPGLGVVPATLVLPHWSGPAGRGDWLRTVDAAVPPGTRVLGIPEESGLVLRDGTVTAVGRTATELVGRRVVLAPGETRADTPDLQEPA
jgi:cyanophycinase